jgi:hypothetical protein
MPLPNRVFASCALLAFLFVSACARENRSGDLLSQGEHLYVDTRLGFAIEHPDSWTRAERGRDASIVRWRAPGGESTPAAAVISLPPSGPAEGMIEEYLAAHPGVTVHRRTERELSAAPAVEVLADSPERRYLVLFLTAGERRFTLEFSARPEDFERHLPLFDEMAGSFTLLVAP